MPGGDRKGPEGMGPMTGRAAGYCAGYSEPGYANPITGRGFYGAGRGGYPWGGGRGRVWGGGRGCGWRLHPLHDVYPYYESYPYRVSAEEEASYLKNEQKYLQERMKDIEKRIKELEKEKSK